MTHRIHHHPGTEIGILIGRNNPSALQPLRIIYGREDEPWAEEYKSSVGQSSVLCVKTDDVTLPNYRDQCLKRLLGIKRKLLKNGKTLKHYTEFMQKIFDKNHARCS